MQDEIELEINTFDNELNLADSEKVTLSAEQIEDIISHAVQFTLMNNFMDMDESKYRVQEELFDALFAAGLLDKYRHLL